MKIEYKFVTGSVEIEIADDWGTLLLDLDREEYNNDHKETRRHYHLEACDYEGEDFAVEDFGFDGDLPPPSTTPTSTTTALNTGQRRSCVSP